MYNILFLIHSFYYTCILDLYVIVDDCNQILHYRVHYDDTIMLIIVFWNSKLINRLEMYNHSVEKKEKNYIKQLMIIIM